MLQQVFPKDDDQDKLPDEHYLLSKRHGGRIEPLHKHVRPEPEPNPTPPQHHPRPPEPQPVVATHQPPTIPEKAANPAVKLIRTKLEALYRSEPSSKQELHELQRPSHAPRSKHQQFMYDLSVSGKSLADIQTAWHNYYVKLPDNEKHAVWQEFYAANARQSTPYTQLLAQQTEAKSVKKTDGHRAEQAHVGIMEPTPPVLPHRPRDRRSARVIKKHILDRVSLETQEKAKRHLKSLAFGISTGAVVLAIFLFGFFNEVVIAPFIQPSRQANATPIILSADSVVPTDKNELIIPKINLEVPLVFDVTSTEEAAIQLALENGVVHYPSTALPGQQGNSAFFGHSSNNIFNKGRYKFAFVLLRTLVPGDIFYLTYNGRVYSYRIFDKRVVEPTDTSVLNPVPGKPATVTLITCDPPGTSLRRMVVWGEQVSPDPAANLAAAPPASTSTQPQTLPSEGPTLWGRFMQWLTN